MLFQIPTMEPTESGITHERTSWILYKDAGLKVSVDASLNSVVNLNAWDCKTIVPVGEVYYLTVERHLYDSNGVPIVSNEIMTKPIISNSSNEGDYLQPDYFIDAPYVTDMLYIPGEYIKLEFNPVETNVTYLDTVIEVKNSAGEIVHSEFINLLTSDNTVTITHEDIDFNSETFLVFTIVHRGTQSVVSSSYVETVELKTVFYSITGTTKELDPTAVNEFKFRATSEVEIQVHSAKLIDNSGEFITNLAVFDNTIILSNELYHNRSYCITYSVDYKDLDGLDKTHDDKLHITIMKRDEKITINREFFYSYKFNKVDNSQIEFLDTTTNFTTEEFYTNLIPYPDNSSNIDLMVYSKSLDKPSEAVNVNYPIAGNFGMRLLNKRKGVIQTEEIDNLIKLLVIDYNTADNTFTTDHTISTNTYTRNMESMNFVDISNEYYLIGLDKTDLTKLIINKVDILTGTITLVASYDLGSEGSDVTVSTILDNRALIYVKGPALDNLLIFSLTDDYVVENGLINPIFVDEPIMMFQLNNGHILGIKQTIANNRVEYFIYDPYEDSLTYDVYYYTDGPATLIKNSTILRDGSVVCFIGEDNLVNTLRFN